jgi:PAS domain S-box-containing protein
MARDPGLTEERLRALVAEAPSAFFVLDHAGTVLAAEGRALRVLGRRGGRQGPGIGRSVFELYVDVPWALDAVRRALGGRTATVTGRIGKRWFEVRLAPRRDGNGRLLEVVGLATDVTERRLAEAALAAEVVERKRVEDALRRQAARLEALAEATRVFAEGLDYKTTLDSVARRLGEQIGDGALIRMISQDGEWLLPVAVYHRDPERLAIRRKLLAASPQRVSEGATGGVLRTAETLRIPNLTQEFVHAVMKPEYWAYLEGVSSLLIVPLAHRHEVMGHITLMRDQGAPPYSAEDEALLEDLAHRAAQAIENARLYGEAQAAVQARDEFLSIASHELRTPLTALKLAVQNMRRISTPDALASIPPAQIERILGAAERQGQRLEKLVEALLDVSRIHMGRLELEVDEVDLAQVVQEASAQFEDELLQSGSTLEIRGEGVRGFWDRLRVSQVVTNLVSNAVKYGAGKPVLVSFGSRGDRAWVQVRDEGIGIDPIDQPQIFERFERAVSSRNYGGLGLGLYIVKRIVEAHGGSVRVESTPGSGAAFSVELPLRPAVPVRAEARLPH